ncbi:MAG: FAD-dependent thymidylate synthase [Candidatus Cloacimonetes bacterium]|nr:FAD-dependent thymidylate synthase [Candidatus Cloacimonadota bacterium]MDY0228597.1 FAD-dependent thymidylate synthase [Candidatus Cloacimonadaceae bacterium]
MKLFVAGYNLDSSLIASLKQDNASPEVISAAYARISRSSKSVEILRQEALNEVEKARKSNENIIFEMGHASVAEHAVFNLDLIDISRLLTETVQRSRLASFTEKSQRYVTFGQSFVVPAELNKKPKLKKAYKDMMKLLFALYEDSFQKLNELYKKERPELKPRDRESLAKEDARYILPLATKTQMGMTINARSLENLLRRLANSPLSEAHELKDLIYNAVQPIAPSLIRHVEPDGYLGQINLNSVGFSGFLQQELPWLAEIDLENKARLVSSHKNADDKVLSALIYSQGELSWQDNLDTVSRLPKMAKEQLWQQVFKGMKVWHKVPRAFETVEFEFELSMSESCWAQFKRHRQCTILKKAGYPGLAIIPSAIEKIGQLKTWQDAMQHCTQLSDALPEAFRPLRDYLKLNSTPCKIYAKMNLREIYHFVRLRSDEHAQWEIRSISAAICAQVQKQAPNASRLLCGKSEFKQIY